MSDQNKKKQNTLLLIDGENISHKKAEQIMKAANSQGRIFGRRVYGRQKDLSTKPWSDEAKKLGIKDIRLCGGPEKDKVDKKIKKDVRKEILHHKNIDIVCIATSDGGFEDIIEELRSQGKRAVIIGEDKSSKKLKVSCNKFIKV